MSARVLLMNSKKSLLSGSLSLSKRHNHLTKLWIEVPNIATRPPGNNSSQAPKEKLPRWWSEVLSRVEVRTAAYVLTKPLLCLSSTTYSTLFYLHSIFNTALLLFLLTDTSDPFHFLPDLPPTLHGQSLMIMYHLSTGGWWWWWAIWSCTILNKPIKKSPVKQKWSFHLAQVGTGGGMWALGELGVPKMESITGINQTAWEGRRVVTYGF